MIDVTQLAGTVFSGLSALIIADVQIKVGNSDPRSAAAVGAMTTVARADDVGGTHAFAVQGRAAGRCVLIWFTRLPPEAGAPGKYQAEIFNVTLRG